MAQGLSLDWLLAPSTVLNRLCDGAGNVDELLAAYRPRLSLVSLVRQGERKEPYVCGRADGSFDVAAIAQDFADGYARVTESADTVTLHFAKSAVTCPPDHRGALHYLANNVELSELPGLSDAQRTDLARTLIVQGFLLRLPGD